MCDKAILENGGTLKFVPDCYKNQEMCNKAVDNYSIISSCNEMGVLNIYLNNVNVDNNFDEDDPHTIILIKLLA